MSRGHILVVDDDESLRRVMQVQLEDLGYNVATAADGDSALRALQLSVRELVISDLKMPAMSGIRSPRPRPHLRRWWQWRRRAPMC